MISCVKYWRLWSVSFLFVFLAVCGGCGKMGIETYASSCSGIREKGGFTYSRWKEGLAIMVCYDIVGMHESGQIPSNFALMKHVWRIKGSDREFGWQVETKDGRTAKFTLDGKDYDLTKGALFLVKTKAGGTQVQQLNHDLSGMQSTSDSLSWKTIAFQSPSSLRSTWGPLERLPIDRKPKASSASRHRNTGRLGGKDR
ncbi:MAG: hypothetical protein NTX50_02885 [Candidatus Sumerlaeota bacterium]|nr:hypothetical protein [Candidatus Sumerlaeota bacterium]